MIRSFQNADLPMLHRLWIEHWSAIGPPPSVREPQLEQAILARTFFQAEHLLIAESDGQAVAWLQFFASLNGPQLMLIPNCCLGDAASAADGVALLEEAARRARQLGGQRIQVGVVRDNHFGYAGLDPIGPGFGVSVFDSRLREILETSGYQSGGDAVTMSVSIPGFRPPVSRESIQFRRATRIEQTPMVYEDPRIAAAMSHLDVETARLVSTDASVSASLNLWFSDPEAEVMNPTRLIVELAAAHQRGRLEAGETYLLASSLQSAALRNILTAETAVDVDRPDLLAQLATLQFAPVAQGSRWTRDL